MIDVHVYVFGRTVNEVSQRKYDQEKERCITPETEKLFDAEPKDICEHSAHLGFLLIQQHRAYSEIDDNEDNQRLTIAHKAAEISSFGKSPRLICSKYAGGKLSPKMRPDWPREETGVIQPENCEAGRLVIMPAAKMAAIWIRTKTEIRSPKLVLAITYSAAPTRRAAQLPFTGTAKSQIAIASKEAIRRAPALRMAPVCPTEIPA